MKLKILSQKLASILILLQITTYTHAQDLSKFKSGLTSTNSDLKGLINPVYNVVATVGAFVLLATIGSVVSKFANHSQDAAKALTVWLASALILVIGGVFVKVVWA